MYTWYDALPECIFTIEFDIFSVIPLDAKYEKMLIELQEAIEDGRANGDCQAKYKCSEPTNAEDGFNLN